MRIRTYRELRRFETFEDRFEYLKLSGEVGVSTFGFDRWLNQAFYNSTEWKHVRHAVIARDRGCDLGIAGYEIRESPLIHHLVPLTVEDITHGSEMMIDLDNLITTTKRTHNAIHYGDNRSLIKPFVERSPGDTQLW